MTETQQAMRLLADAGAIFVGQGVAADGVAIYRDLLDISPEQRIEFPVAEELNLGYCTGLALTGFLPVMILPRCDFLLRAADQLVNHLDKIEQMSAGQWAPKVIIRVQVGTKTPLDAGPQHTQNHAAAFRLMLTSVAVREITARDQILPVYREALASPRSSLVVEAVR